MRQLLLQNATGITKCDRCYYKMRQVLQNATLSQNATVHRALSISGVKKSGDVKNWFFCVLHLQLSQ